MGGWKLEGFLNMGPNPMVSSYVPTPGASGAAELGFAELFRMVVPPALIGLAVARWRLRTYYFTLLVGGTLTLGRQGMRDEFWAGVQQMILVEVL